MNETKDAVIIERIFHAPTALIWQMWTDADHFKQWYGPNGATVPVAKMDLRVGGQRLIAMAMQTPKGEMKMWTVGEFKEISPTHRLIYTESPSDENGKVLLPGMMGRPPGYPEMTEVHVELEDLDGRTKMTMRHVGIPADSGAKGGWGQAFDKLAALL